MSETLSPRLIAVVDCGLGNIHSLLGCLNRLLPNDQIEFGDDPEVIAKSDCVLLPGDGSFSACIEQIDKRNLRELLVDAARSKPFLGICVGMQVLFESSAEGEGEGLGVLSGHVERFPDAEGAKVPLMGWLDIDKGVKDHQLTASIEPGTRYYFLHSYFVPASNENTILAGTHTASFAAAVAKDQLVATQFHPEKSSKEGVSLLRDFFAGLKKQG